MALQTDTTSTSTASSLSTQAMPFSMGDDESEANSTSTTPRSNQSPPALARLNLNLTTEGLLTPDDINKTYDESAMTIQQKRRLLMSVYKQAKVPLFGEDSLKTVKRICNEHIVRKVKFINGEFLNDMTKTQRIKAMGFGTVYQPDFSDTSPSLWNDVLQRMPQGSRMTLQMKAVTWMGILPTVISTIRSYRNNVQSKIKGRASNKGSLINALQIINTQGFETSYTGDDLNLLYGLKTIQALAEGFREDTLMKIRDKKSNDLFKAFVHYFLQHTITRAEWISARGTDLISEIFTPVDEGFAILLIINHWQEWKHVAAGNVIDRRKKLTRYTHCFRGASAFEDNLSFNGGATQQEGNLTIPSLTSTIPRNVVVNKGTTNTILAAQDDEDESVSVQSSGNSSTVTTTTASTNSNSTTNQNKHDSKTSMVSSSSHKGHKKKARSAKLKGWSNEGLRKFSEICKHIHAIRKETEQETMEKTLLTEYQKMDQEGVEETSRKRRREEEQELDVLEEEPFNMYAV